MTTSLLNSLLRALLRWGAALVFCLPLRHRTHFWARACGMLFPLLLLAQLLDPLAQSTTLWQQGRGGRSRTFSGYRPIL